MNWLGRLFGFGSQQNPQTGQTTGQQTNVGTQAASNIGGFLGGLVSKLAMPLMLLMGIGALISPKIREMFSGLFEQVMGMFSGGGAENDSPGAEETSGRGQTPDATDASYQPGRDGQAIAQAAASFQATNPLVDAQGNEVAPVAFLDVGHGGTIIGANNEPLTDDEIGKLTFQELESGLEDGSLKISTAGYDPGAVSPIDGSTEFEHNLLQAIALKDELKSQGVEVILHVGKDRPGNLKLSERREQAAEAGAEMFISFHNNAGGGKGSEVFHDGSPGGKRLAEAINRNWEQTGRTTRGAKHESATAVGSLGVLPDPSDRRDIDVDSVLLEGGFLDNSTDIETLNNPDFIESYAQSIANAVNERFLARGYSRQMQVAETSEISSPPPTTQAEPGTPQHSVV